MYHSAHWMRPINHVMATVHAALRTSAPVTRAGMLPRIAAPASKATTVLPAVRATASRRDRRSHAAATVPAMDLVRLQEQVLAHARPTGLGPSATPVSQGMARIRPSVTSPSAQPRANMALASLQTSAPALPGGRAAAAASLIAATRIAAPGTVRARLQTPASAQRIGKALLVQIAPRSGDLLASATLLFVKSHVSMVPAPTITSAPVTLDGPDQRVARLAALAWPGAQAMVAA